MSAPTALESAARLPSPGDNAAIAIRRLAAGTAIFDGTKEFSLSHTVLEGHRFAIESIDTGRPLLSWGLPFGVAIRPIKPGDYICNESIIAALRQRHVDFQLPEAGNFKNQFAPVILDKATFCPGESLPRYAESPLFEGFARTDGRGVGTRNYIAVLGTSSLTASYCRALADRFKNAREAYPNIDGVVAIAHTEGGGTKRPNNFDFVVRTLAGFMTNPNIGAALAVDFGHEAVNNRTLLDYLRTNNYPLENLPHKFLSVSGAFEQALAQGEQIVRSWLESVNACHRTWQPLEHLRLGLQCGGSDAFSGISGNPLAGWVSKELVRHGGSANLAETDELIGAEPYILSRVRDFATARSFLDKLKIFQDRAGWHGSSAEGNPSGGNMFRGLYNIAIKSIGAARKKDPQTRLDYVIDYGERMTAPGYYFMDSPGNDLESIAGQVAAGCNVILFTTGNGSITNFPFVPTIKVMTNTPRFNLLQRDMDFNAGRYLDGTPMKDLGAEAFDYLLKIASGQRSIGEIAGHSQVQLWREWRQTNGAHLEEILNAPKPDGRPIPIKDSFQTDAGAMKLRFMAWNSGRGTAADQIGLIVPTSLCSGQIARMIADKLNQADASAGEKMHGPRRYAALPHTEGCGVSGGESERLHLRTLCGYLAHPFVRHGLLLEHGCERTHNHALEDALEEHGMEPGRYGWASVQLDGGIDKVVAKVIRWFGEEEKRAITTGMRQAGLAGLRIGLTSVGPLSRTLAQNLARLAGTVVRAGGTVVVPFGGELLCHSGFWNTLFENPPGAASLAYGQQAKSPGFHTMDTPTDHHVETMTGLGATGVEIIIAAVDGPTVQAHAMIPLIQITTDSNPCAAESKAVDWDLIWDTNQNPNDALNKLWDLVFRTAGRDYTPKLFASGNRDFQITRGLLGVSL